MNSHQASPDQVWSRRRFLVVLVSVFVLQLVWLFAFGRPDAASQANVSVSTTFRMVARTLPAGVFDGLLVTDPTLFVLPSRDSFSGPAWLNVKDMDFSPAEWNEPPSWLRLKHEALTATFNSHVDRNRKPLMQATDKPAPYEPEPSLPVATSRNTRVMLDNSIANRLESKRPELKAWPHSEPLDHSVVEMGIDELGRVVTVRLLHRSGSPAADQAALRTASSLAFAPSASNEWTVGKVYFIWQTEPVAATNGTAKTNSEGP